MEKRIWRTLVSFCSNFLVNVLLESRCPTISKRVLVHFEKKKLNALDWQWTVGVINNQCAATINNIKILVKKIFNLSKHPSHSNELQKTHIKVKWFQFTVLFLIQIVGELLLTQSVLLIAGLCTNRILCRMYE